LPQPVTSIREERVSLNTLATSILGAHIGIEKNILLSTIVESIYCFVADILKSSIPADSILQARHDGVIMGGGSKSTCSQ
jgi:hypothetical protein